MSTLTVQTPMTPATSATNFSSCIFLRRKFARERYR